MSLVPGQVCRQTHCRLQNTLCSIPNHLRRRKYGKRQREKYSTGTTYKTRSTLVPWGSADMWAFLVETTAEFHAVEGKDEELEAKLVFKDFKLKGISELITDLEAAKRSEAGQRLLQNIQDNIARLMYCEHPEQYQKWAVQEKFNPFSGMNSDMVSLALSDPAVPQKYKVRYLMLGVIFSELESANADFYKLAADAQTRALRPKSGYMKDTKRLRRRFSSCRRQTVNNPTNGELMTIRRNYKIRRTMGKAI